MRRITWSEALAIFIGSIFVYSFSLHLIYKEATTDYSLRTGYITSKIYRPEYHYWEDQVRHTEPPLWLIETQNHKPSRNIQIKSYIHSKKGVEYCWGECYYHYYEPYTDEKPHPFVILSKVGSLYPRKLSSQRWMHIKIGDLSVVKLPYYNPLIVSENTVSVPVKSLPRFSIYQENRSVRLVASNVTQKQIQTLEKINAQLASKENISVGLVISSDPMMYEKLKKVWRGGRNNEFTVVIDSPNGKRIRNVNVLAWNNDELKEQVREAIAGLPNANIDDILNLIQAELMQEKVFHLKDFKLYDYLSERIPRLLYIKLYCVQFLFLLYYSLLMYFNPNSKEKKLSWRDIKKTWSSSRSSYCPISWYLHPLSSLSFVFYLLVPIFITHFFLK